MDSQQEEEQKDAVPDDVLRENALDQKTEKIEPEKAGENSEIPHRFSGSQKKRIGRMIQQGMSKKEATNVVLATRGPPSFPGKKRPMSEGTNPSQSVEEKRHKGEGPVSALASDHADENKVNLISYLKNSERIDIFTWNVEGKSGPTEIDRILQKQAIFKGKTPIICLQHASLPAEGDGTENYNWYCSGKYGSAVLIDKKFEDVGFVKFDQPCEEICIADITFVSEIRMKIISCYIPPSTDLRCEDLWLKLTEIIKALPINDVSVVGGDLNAQIGKYDFDSNLDLGNLGPTLHHNFSNENGKRLHQLLRSSHMRMLGSYRKNKVPCHTYESKGEKSQQDCLLVTKMLPHVVVHHYCREVWVSNYNHALHFASMKIINQEINKHSPKTLKLQSWNIQGTTPDKVDKVASELDLPLVCVQEAFLTSEDDIKSNNYEWHTSKKLWAKNVGILLKKDPNIVLGEFNLISHCLCSAKVTYYGTEFIIFCCYLLDCNPEYKEVEQKLIELLRALPEDSLYLIAGEFSQSLDENGKEDSLCQLNKEQKLSSFRAIAQEKMWKVGTAVAKNKSYGYHDIYFSNSLKQMNMKTATNFRWIPFYSCCIFDLEMERSEREAIAEETMKALEDPNSSKKVIESDSEVARVHTHQLKYEGSFFDYEDIIPKPLEPEVVERFKDKSPSPEELHELIKDFVIYHGPNNTSELTSKQNLLANSFVDNKLGKLTFEDVEVYSKETHKFIRKYTKIVWNGIQLMEASSEEKLTTVYRLKSLAMSKLLTNLIVNSYHVKGRMSFFHKGMEPILMDDLKIVGIMRPVPLKEFPMAELFQYVDKTLADDSDVELVFGNDFNEKQFREIETYAAENKLGWRYFKNKSDKQNLALYKRLTPSELRDKLKENPEDFKYFLIPPKESQWKNLDFMQYVAKHEGIHCKEESRVISSFYNSSFLPKKELLTGKLKKKVLPKQAVNGSKPIEKKRSLAQKLLDIKKKSAPGQVETSSLKNNERMKSFSSVKNKYTERRGGLVNKRHPPPGERRSADLPRGNQLDKRYSTPSESRALYRHREDVREPSRSTTSLKGNFKRFKEEALRESSRSIPSPRGGYQRFKEDFDEPSRQTSSLKERFQRVKAGRSQTKSRLNPWETTSSGSVFDQPNLTSNSQVNPWSVQSSESLVSYPIRADRLMQESNRTTQLLSQQVNSQTKMQQPANNLFLQPSELLDMPSTNNLGISQQGVNQSFGMSFWPNQGPGVNQLSGMISSLPIQGQGQGISDPFGMTSLPFQGQGVNQSFGMSPWPIQVQGVNQSFAMNSWPSQGPAQPQFDAKVPPIANTWTQEPHWTSLGPLIIVYPIKANSQLEDSPRKILEYNFTVDYVEDNDSSWMMCISLPSRDGGFRRHNICGGPRKDSIAELAFQLIVKRSTIIKPLQNYLCDGEIPDFIRRKIPCPKNPRKYIILAWTETGPLYEDTVGELLDSFMDSANDDLFFDRDTYTIPEKMTVIAVAEKKNLLVRHFGDLPSIADRYVCVYKKRTSYQIFDEIDRQQGHHYKYEIVIDRYPPIG